MLHIKLPNCPLGRLSWDSAVRLPMVVARTGRLPQTDGQCMLGQPSVQWHRLALNVQGPRGPQNKGLSFKIPALLVRSAFEQLLLQTGLKSVPGDAF